MNRRSGVPSTARMTVEEMLPHVDRMAGNLGERALLWELEEVLDEAARAEATDETRTIVEAILRFIAGRRGGITALRTWLAKMLDEEAEALAAARDAA